MPTSNINNVVLTGRLTSDPDLRALPSGSSVCHLRVAVNARRRDASTGEWGEKPNFFDIVVFGARGETVARYMHKGRAVAIEITPAGVAEFDAGELADIRAVW